MKSLIKRIDLQRQQVFLEVLIVEVGVDKNNLFGIDWIFGRGGSAAERPAPQNQKGSGT